MGNTFLCTSRRWRYLAVDAAWQNWRAFDYLAVYFGRRRNSLVCRFQAGPSRAPEHVYVLFVMAMNATFAAFIEQYGLTINLFVLRHVNLDVHGVVILAPQLQGRLSLLLICSTPVVIWSLNFLATRPIFPSSLLKMSAGCSGQQIPDTLLRRFS